MQGAWCAATEAGGDYLEISLPHLTLVSGMGIQGRFDEPQWVTSYTVSYHDGAGWVDGAQVYDGTTGQQTVVQQQLETPLYAMAVRIQPVAWIGWPALRVELYTCRGGGLLGKYYQMTPPCAVWPSVGESVPSVVQSQPSLDFGVTSLPWPGLAFADNYVAHYTGALNIITPGS